MAKPRGETRDRSFGGKAGIWLKKRKQSVAVHPANEDQENNKVTPPSIDDNAGTNVTVKPKETTVGGATTTTKQRTVVGWDDVRCRPIYRETSSSSSSSTSSREDNDAIENVLQETRDDGSSEDDDGSVEEEDREDVHSTLLATRNDRKTRAYGSRKRKPASNLLSSLAPESNDNRKRRHVPSKKQERAAAVMTPSINRMTFDLATPQTAGPSNNICGALNSDTKATPLVPLAKRKSTNNAQVLKEEAKPKKKSLLGKKRTKQPQQPPALPSLAQLDFCDENVISQPSSTTSLAAARAFFERLDAQQKLTLDASGTPVAQGKKVVRTRRAVHIHSDALREEYQEYAGATRATGVKPLSIKQYAVNRSAFFRNGDVYDGFLDG